MVEGVAGEEVVRTMVSASVKEMEPAECFGGSEGA